MRDIGLSCTFLSHCELQEDGIQKKAGEGSSGWVSEGSLGSLPPIPDHRVSSQERLASEICERARERVRSGNARVNGGHSQILSWLQIIACCDWLQDGWESVMFDTQVTSLVLTSWLITTWVKLSFNPLVLSKSILTPKILPFEFFLL